MSRKNHSSLRRVLILVVVLAACSADSETVVLSTGPSVVARPRAWGADDGSVQSLTALDAAAAVDLWNSTVAWNAAVAENERLAEEAARQARESRPAPTYNGGGASFIGDHVPCGGGLPSCCIVARESGGVWHALNPRALAGEPRGAGGAYQFIPSTWHAYGGHGYADQASPAEQIAVARRAWADYPRHWSPLC